MATSAACLNLIRKISRLSVGCLHSVPGEVAQAADLFMTSKLDFLYFCCPPPQMESAQILLVSTLLLLLSHGSPKSSSIQLSGFAGCYIPLGSHNELISQGCVSKSSTKILRLFLLPRMTSSSFSCQFEASLPSPLLLHLESAGGDWMRSTISKWESRRG